jgi:hypothetical protein
VLVGTGPRGGERIVARADRDTPVSDQSMRAYFSTIRQLR